MLTKKPNHGLGVEVMNNGIVGGHKSESKAVPPETEFPVLASGAYRCIKTTNFVKAVCRNRHVVWSKEFGILCRAAKRKYQVVDQQLI